MQTTYIKIISASGSGHKYQVEHYSSSGELIETTDTTLANLDKRCSSKFKLRVTSPWGILMRDKSILPVGLPKFLRK